MKINYQLYLCTDASLSNNLLQDVEKALQGGVTLLQVREKNLSTRDFLEIAKEMVELGNRYQVPVIINDRMDIAILSKAHGVHLGQKDLHLSEAKKFSFPKNFIFGVSVSNLDQALEAEKYGADYVGIGAVFDTLTKHDITKPLGLDGLKAITKNITIPSVAIGGIDIQNAQEVIQSGVHGIAVISAILGKNNKKQAAKTLKNIITPYI